MTTAPDPGTTGAELRLHPLSWLFVLLQQLKQFALPLLVLLFTGRGDSSEFWPLVGVAVLALYSLIQYHSFRYRLDGDGIVLRSGVLQKNLRNIPFGRIHNVALHQSLLHRIFGVAEVQLESAGGEKPEAQMRVLSLAEAQRLEALVRGHVRERPEPDVPEASSDRERELLSLDVGEVVRLGLVSNRGMLVVAAMVGVLVQGGSDVLGDLVRAIVGPMFGWARSAQAGVLAWVLGAIVLFIAIVLTLRLFSVLLALLQFHGFRLVEVGSRLQVERGLLTRWRGSLARSRIQAFSLHEGWLHRRFGRRSLRADSAGAAAEGEQGSLRDLVPLATLPTMDALIAGLLSPGQWPPAHWRPLHPKAWRREFALPALSTLAVGFALSVKFGALGLLAWCTMPLWWLRARAWARHAGYTEQAGLIVVREGWLDRHWRFAEIGKLQNLQLSQSPFDRRHGMASLHLDTLGAGALASPLRIPYLPVDEARALMARLASRMEG